MKKIIAIVSLAFLFCTVQSQAQWARMKATIPSAAGNEPAGADSVRVNGATATYLYVKATVGGYKCASLQGNITRITAADNGTVTLQGSNDGINYVATAAADTFHVTNAATQTSAITIAPATGVLYQYYRLKAANTATTDTCTLKAFFFGRQ